MSLLDGCQDDGAANFSRRSRSTVGWRKLWNVSSHQLRVSVQWVWSDMIHVISAVSSGSIEYIMFELLSFVMLHV